MYSILPKGLFPIQESIANSRQKKGHQMGPNDETANVPNAEVRVHVDFEGCCTFHRPCKASKNEVNLLHCPVS